MEVERIQTVCCYCGIPAREYVSWTDANPNRRFWRCSKFTREGTEHCEFYMWIDPPLCARAMIVINRLQTNRNILQNQLRSLRDSQAELQVELDVMRAREMVLEEQLNESNARQHNGWIVGVGFWIYLLAAKFAMQKMIEENNELEQSAEYLQNEVDTLRLKMRKLILVLIMSWCFFVFLFLIFWNDNGEL